jgi:hypothetical protein
MLDGAEDKVGACWECGYSLRGLETPRCPECGRPFDPNDPTTMNMGISVGPVKRWLMRPPGWPLYLLTGAAALVSLWAAAAPTWPGLFVDTLGHPEEWHPVASDFGLPEGRFLWGAVLWTIVLLTWTTRRLARGVTVLRLSKQKAAAFAYWRRWLWPLVVFGLTVATCLTPLPVLGGFWLSRVSLDAAVKAGGLEHPAGHWIGIYPLGSGPSKAVEAHKGQTWVFLWDDSRSDPGGFIYCDPGVEPDEPLVIGSYYRRRIRFKRMSERWYSFRAMGPYEN